MDPAPSPRPEAGPRGRRPRLPSALAVLALAAATGCAGDCPQRAVLDAPDPSRPTCTVPAG